MKRADLTSSAARSRLLVDRVTHGSAWLVVFSLVRIRAAAGLTSSKTAVRGGLTAFVRSHRRSL